jgi:aerobic carbon-monoxide dehydrogenase large subunit
MTGRPPGWVGISVPRREDRRLLTGRGRYVANVNRPGLKHAAFVRSTVARAEIIQVDTTRAAAVSGVRAIFSKADLGAVIEGPFTPTLYLGASSGPSRLLADGDVRYVGEPIALVIGDDPYVAADAALLVEVDYFSLPPVIDYEVAARSEHIVNPERGSNVASRHEHDNPTCDAAVRNAAHVVTATIRQQRQANAPMEPRGVVASWDAANSSLEVHISTQNPHEVRQVLARALATPEADVRVIKGDVGGGFGQKFLLLTEEVAVAAAARLSGHPLKWIEERQENLTSATHARADRVTATLGLDDGGRMLAVRIDHLEDVGALPMGGSGGSGPAVVTRFTGPYLIPHAAWTTTAVHTNTCRRGAYRGPWMMETTAREQLVDEAARQLGMDPLELRRRNVIRAHHQPYRAPGGFVVDGVKLAESLEHAAALIDYEGFRSQQVALRRQGCHRGIGMSLFYEPQGSVAAIRSESATVCLNPDGSVTVALGSGNHGQGLETTIAQIVADQLAVDLDSVRVHDGDTASTPFGNGTGGSRSAPVLAPAAASAAGLIRERLLAIASHELEAAPEDLRLEAGRVTVVGTPARSRTLADLARAATTGALPPQIDTNLQTTMTHRLPGPVYSNACHMCTCEVDVDTGLVTLLRYVVSEDCGALINPMIVEGQVAGGVAQGIGGALYEQMVYDEAGNPLTATFADYTIPGVCDVPWVEYHHVPTDSAPDDFRGVGESGAIGAPACVLNAVADALAPFGVGIPEPPLTPAKVRNVISGAVAERPLSC